ncbi:DUF1365 domain-containing protein [Actinacidiphila bryophytorum]|uniref:DUF1365 domain-containing protein n=1 Tax=Actinacidiphila bryophytorum TaxID=1436133 RepID=A0A9W4H4I9_9ACTN|nr:DUF1365 domain-containing protein [Actinacidiphila bryophytorum]MBM9435794.1 DUF1365 domain-containing protein [Actinacidiphila bryophytorum]CAG7650201.1 conserved hypothetical protein [Actinacidiphila bryophytorum]
MRAGQVHAPGSGTAPALYECVVAHARTTPVRHSFRHRTYMWLVDVDHLPVLPVALRPLAGFDPRDHFGGAREPLRTALERFLAVHDIHLDGGRVLMLTHARVLGHVFNPLTLYWCSDRAGSPLCVVAEVHNTYGDRHCYLLRPDAEGRAEVRKELYVSPFFPVDGSYKMRLPQPGERLGVTVRLRRGDDVPFTAALRGTRRPATARQLLAAAVRHPWSTLAVSAAIKMHGIHLYLRGLPVTPRPSSAPQEGLK